MKTMNIKDVCRMEKINLYMHAENESAMKRNEAVSNDLSGEFYKIKGNGKIPDNCRYSLTAIQGTENKKQTTEGGFSKFLKLKISAKVS